MIIFRQIRIALFLLLGLSLPCSAADSCQHGDLESFRAAWKTYLDASINGTPEKIADFYVFPLTLTEDKQFSDDVKISRDSFIKNYDLIFRGQLKGNKANSSLIDGFKVASEVGKMDDFDAAGCSYFGRAEWYGIEFKWSENGRWLVFMVERDQLKLLMKKMK